MVRPQTLLGADFQRDHLRTLHQRHENYQRSRTVQSRFPVGGGIVGFLLSASRSCHFCRFSGSPLDGSPKIGSFAAFQSLSLLRRAAPLLPRGSDRFVSTLPFHPKPAAYSFSLQIDLHSVDQTESGPSHVGHTTRRVPGRRASICTQNGPLPSLRNRQRERRVGLVAGWQRLTWR